MLYVLRYFEREEKYEECAKIIQELKGFDLPTEINKEAIDIVINSYHQFGLICTNLDRYKVYSEIIIKEICGKK